METNQNARYSWAETFYEVVSYLERHLNSPELYDHQEDGKLGMGMRIKEWRKEIGHADLVEFAMHCADQFEKKNEGRDWDGEFYDEVWEFMNTKMDNLL